MIRSVSHLFTDSPDLDVINVPTTVLPHVVGSAHSPAEIDGGLVISNGRDIKFLIDPGVIGNLRAVFPNVGPASTVIADPNISMIVGGSLNSKPPPELQGDT